MAAQMANLYGKLNSNPEGKHNSQVSLFASACCLWLSNLVCNHKPGDRAEGFSLQNCKSQLIGVFPQSGTIGTSLLLRTSLSTLGGSLGRSVLQI